MMQLSNRVLQLNYFIPCGNKSLQQMLGFLTSLQGLSLPLVANERVYC